MHLVLRRLDAGQPVASARWCRGFGASQRLQPGLVCLPYLEKAAKASIINGAIPAFLMTGHGHAALSADTIGTTGQTVLGTAVLLATILAMILTAIGHVTLNAPKYPFLPDGLRPVVRHGRLAFGAVVASAVFWQRFPGTVVFGVPRGDRSRKRFAGICLARVLCGNCPSLVIDGQIAKEDTSA